VAERQREVEQSIAEWNDAVMRSIRSIGMPADELVENVSRAIRRH
jgi:hypothetical protein